MGSRPRAVLLSDQNGDESCICWIVAERRKDGDEMDSSRFLPGDKLVEWSFERFVHTNSSVLERMDHQTRESIFELELKRHPSTHQYHTWDQAVLSAFLSRNQPEGGTGVMIMCQSFVIICIVELNVTNEQTPITLQNWTEQTFSYRDREVHSVTRSSRWERDSQPYSQLISVL